MCSQREGALVPERADEQPFGIRKLSRRQEAHPEHSEHRTVRDQRNRRPGLRA